MNLKDLKNEALHEQTKSLAKKERQTTIEILWHLCENQKRMLYAKMNYKSLKDYCVHELKYSEGSAWRRISAMRLLVDLPEVETKIENGTLNLTQIILAQTHFKEVKATTCEKIELIEAIENQSARRTERILAEQKPEFYVAKPEVIEKPLKGQRLEVTFVLDAEIQNQLEEIQVLLGKPYTKLDLLKLMAKEKLEQLKKKSEKTERKSNLKDKDKTVCAAQPARSCDVTAEERFGVEKSRVGEVKLNKSRYISRSILRDLKQRDQHRCQFKDSITHQQCEAKFYLQVEHKLPFARGGANDLSNLELLCPNHNKLRAVQQFGTKKMKNYLHSLK